MSVSGDLLLKRLNKLSKLHWLALWWGIKVSCEALLVQSLALWAETNEIWQLTKYENWQKRNKYFWDDDGTEHLAVLSLPSRCKLIWQNTIGGSNMFI